MLGISSSYRLTDELNLSQSTVAAYETGKLEMGLNTLSYLYSKYGVLPHYIVTGDGDAIDNNKSRATPSEAVKQMQSNILALKALVEGLTKEIKSLKKYTKKPHLNMFKCGL